MNARRTGSILIMLLVAFAGLGGCSFVSSKHWDETTSDDQKKAEIREQAKSDEDREYLEQVEGNSGSAIFRFEDTHDREIEECERRGYRNCSP